MPNCYSILTPQSFSLGPLLCGPCRYRRPHERARSWYDGNRGTVGPESYGQQLGLERSDSKGGLVGHMDRPRIDRGCGRPVRERAEHQVEQFLKWGTAPNPVEVA